MLSAIVPTHDRPVVLSNCLKTLIAQEVGAGELEIVVVDDGSDSDIGALVRALSPHGPFAVRYERQPLGGLNKARNRGAAAAHGEVLAFLDDDTLVSPGWAGALLEAFARHACAAVGGRVTLRLAAPAPVWLTDVRHHLAEYDLGDEPCWLSEHPELIPIPVGANFAVRRSEFERIGGFRTGLDRLGHSLISNGDTEFVLRLRSTGGRLRYEACASVIHCVPEERLTERYMTRRHYAQGISDELMRRQRGRSMDLAHLAGLARGLGGAGKMICASAVRREDATMGRFWACYWAGRLVGAARARALLDKSDEASLATPI